MRFRMHVPPSYCGSRLLMCLMLSIVLAAFFLIYDRVTHREMPSLSDSLKPRTIVTLLIPVHGYGGVNESRAPDMNSAEVRFANADVLQASDAIPPKTVEPRKPEIKLIVEPKQKARILKAMSNSAKHARLARIQGSSYGRAAYAQNYSAGFRMFRQF